MKSHVFLLKLALPVLTIILPAIGFAQDLKIVSIIPTQNKIDSSQLPRDLNDNLCVPLYIGLKNPSVSFEGNVIGTPKFLEGQYLVYLTAQSKFLSIKYPGLAPLMVKFSDYGISSLDNDYMYVVSMDEPSGNLSQDLNRGLASSTSDEAESLYEEGGRFLSSNDYIHAYEYFLKAYNLGHPKSACYLGFIYSDPYHAARKIGKLSGMKIPDNPVKRDLTKAFQFYLESAEAGYVTAQFAVGECYEKGDGVKKNEDEAQKWFEKAAAQGHLQAQEKLGNKTKHNKIGFVTVSYGTSENEFIVSSMTVDVTDLSARTYGKKDRNNEDCALIKVHLPFEGVSFIGDIVGEPIFKTNEYWVYVTQGSEELEIRYPDYKPTKVNFKKLGISDLVGKTTYHLKLSYPIDLITGDSGLTADDYYEVAIGYLERRDNQNIRWMTKAAELGHLKAMYYMGSNYLYGNGVPKDKERGISLLEESAEKGLIESAELLGLYYNTLGRNKKKSKMWYEKAEMLQNQNANSGRSN